MDVKVLERPAHGVEAQLPLVGQLVVEKQEVTVGIRAVLDLI